MTALFSLRPRYADRVLEGRKTVEIRTRTIRLVPGDTLWFYVSQPKAVVIGCAKLVTVYQGAIDEVWRQFSQKIGISRSEYYEYAKAHEVVSALEFNSLEFLVEPLSLNAIRTVCREFHPPQFYVRLHSGSDLHRLLNTLERTKRKGGSRASR